MSLILSVDPGVTSGLAMKLDQEIVTTCAFSDAEVLKFINNTKWDLVIYEDFNSGGRISKYGQNTIRLIGKIELLCTQKNIKTCKHQPQNRYCAISKAIMQLKNVKHLKHENEALSHLFACELLKHFEWVNL